MDRPSEKFISLDVDCDRSDDQQFNHQLPVPKPSKEAKEEGREPINRKLVGVTAPLSYGPSSCTERDKSPLRCFYTPTNDPASSSTPSSSSSKPMPAVTRHSYSDFTLPAPPAVAPAPAPLSSPVASSERPSNPTVPCGEEPRQGGKGKKSISRLCFPFVTTSPKRKDKDKDRKPGMANVSVFAGSANASTSEPPPATPPLSASSLLRRHNHSCSPTRFCPSSVKRALPVQKRWTHAYANRGYSHEALEYVKWFWTVRQQGKAYMEEPMIARTVHPASALGNEPASSRPTTAAAPSTATEAKPMEEKSVPASIHPRRGDISALRDSQCAEVDQAFAALDVWTITKMVWMVEVGVGMERSEREKEEERRRRRSRLRMSILWDENEDEDGDEGGSLLTRSTSTGSLSDDSEMTLVDESLSSASSLLPLSYLKEDGGDGDTDEENDERLQLVIRGRKLTPQAQGSHHTRTLSLSPGRESDLDMDLRRSDLDRRVPRPLYQPQVEPSKATWTGAGCSQLEWATDWTSRWEIVRNFSQAKKFYFMKGNALSSTSTSKWTLIPIPNVRTNALTQ